MTVAIITGVSESGASLVAAEVALLLGSAETYELGSRMLAVATALGRPVASEKILDSHPASLAFLRAAAFEEILGDAQVALRAHKHVLLSVHTTFRWRKTLEPAFGFSFVRRLVEVGQESGHDVVFINIVDTIPATWTRITRSTQWAGRIDFEELLLWRDEESLVTRMLADYARVPFFQVGREEPTDVLARLVADPKAPKAYFSFPITALTVAPDKVKDALDFGAELRKRIVTFDPLSVKDKAWLEGHAEYPDCPLVPSAVSAAARSYIDNQTVARDLQFIDQSDLVAVWYGTDKVSFGVAAEIFHGFTTGKDVFIFHPMRPSPFLTYFTSEVFDGEAVMLDRVATYSGGRTQA